MSKRFGDVVALRELDLEIGRGEFLTLLGPSGCGKTTTLRLIAGFELPDTGAIELDGHDVAQVPPYRRPVNTVFQQYALFPHLSVAENIGYGLRHGGVPKDEVRRRVAEMMELMEIPDVGDRRPRQLSGGQQQRVALARALVMNPKVLLLDEPLGSLDYKLRKGMQFELKRLHREVGTTFVYVTHDQDEAMTMSDRIVVMRDGVVEQIGTPSEVFDEPSSAFVAGFVGDTNLLPGRAVAVADGRVSVDLGVLGQVEGTTSDSIADGDEVMVSLRPADISLEEDPNATAEVQDAVLVGGHIESKVAANGETVIAHLPRDLGVAPGSRVALRVDSRRARVFARA